jgi:hypothetical protein
MFLSAAIKISFPTFLNRIGFTNIDADKRNIMKNALIAYLTIYKTIFQKKELYIAKLVFVLACVFSIFSSFNIDLGFDCQLLILSNILLPFIFAWVISKNNEFFSITNKVWGGLFVGFSFGFPPAFLAVTFNLLSFFLFGGNIRTATILKQTIIDFTPSNLLMSVVSGLEGVLFLCFICGLVGFSSFLLNSILIKRHI